jgi:hypothetical protein
VTYHSSRDLRDDGLSLDYVPNAHRKCQASPDYWTSGTFKYGDVRGYAGNDDGLYSLEPNTVLCTYADGRREVRTVASFRRAREPRETRRVTEARKPTEAERFLPSMVEILGEYN